MDDPTASDAKERADFVRAVAERDYPTAFAAYQSCLLARAMALLRSQAYAVELLKTPGTLLELTGGLANALERQIEEEGDKASYKLLVARDVVMALAEMHALLAEPLEQPGRTVQDVIAVLLFQAVKLGTVEVEVNQTLGGFLDTYAGLAWNQHQAGEGRRKGATTTNDLKAQNRSDALHEAQAITKTNPTLSNDDLAYHLKQKARLTFSTRTLAGWIRSWRQDGLLPPLR